ncbi:MAG TPA: hypothetical protein VNZ53_26600 [Steroidobacteraceae bacterium]|jgi:hypothetical protein|nr:hypothetical protein [Steroidobacteraceae bacterium]
MSDAPVSSNPVAQLQAIAGEGVLVVVVSADAVKFATEHHESFYDADNDRYMVKVADEQTWLESVARCLNAELGESGETLLSQAFDKAIYEAVDQGEEGLADEAAPPAETKEPVKESLV